MSKKFVFSVVLTVMDCIVFALCVDKGLTPVGIVGACYIALRLFGRDSQDAVNLFEPFTDKVHDWIKQLKTKISESKKEETPDE